MITYLAQIAEANSPGVLFHFGYNFINVSHIIIVSILISMSRGKIKGMQNSAKLKTHNDEDEQRPG